MWEKVKKLFEHIKSDYTKLKAYNDKNKDKKLAGKFKRSKEDADFTAEKKFELQKVINSRLAQMKIFYDLLNKELEDIQEKESFTADDEK